MGYLRIFRIKNLKFLPLFSCSNRICETLFFIKYFHLFLDERILPLLPMHFYEKFSNLECYSKNIFYLLNTFHPNHFVRNCVLCRIRKSTLEYLFEVENLAKIENIVKIESMFKNRKFGQKSKICSKIENMVKNRKYG